MQTHDKETLISLSLAGTIGFYLFNKLSEAGVGLGNETKEYGVEEIPQEVVEYTVAEPEELFDDTEPTVEEPIEYYDEEDETVEVEDVFDELGDEQFEEQTVEESVEEVVQSDDLLDGLDDILAEEPVEEVIEKEDVVFCPRCGTKNSTEYTFCNNCGSALIKAEEKAEEKVEEAFTPFVESDLTPELDNPFGSFTQLPKAEPKVEPVVEAAKPVQTEMPQIASQPATLDLGTEGIMDDMMDIDDMDDMDEIDDMMDDSVEDLFNTGLPTASVMDNTEKLHKIDDSDASAKKEFKSIEDFFDTI